MHKIAQGKVAEIEYTLRLSDGEIADETAGEPMAYLHGSGELIPGLEAALEGRGAGDKFSITIAPKDGFGEEDDELVREMPRDELPSDLEMVEGEEIVLSTDDGEEVTAFVEEVGENTVCLDFNHPLAGEVLHFDVQVVAVRDATPEELSHGHAHGEEDEDEDESDEDEAPPTTH